MEVIFLSGSLIRKKTAYFFYTVGSLKPQAKPSQTRLSSNLRIPNYSSTTASCLYNRLIGSWQWLFLFLRKDRNWGQQPPDLNCIDWSQLLLVVPPPLSSPQYPAMADKVDYYSVLGCDPSSSEEQIRTEFRLRARQTHPDKDGCKEEFQARFWG